MTTPGATAHASEHIFRIRWDCNNLLPCGRYSEILIDGVSTLGSVGAWTFVEQLTTIHVGSRNGPAQAMNGLIVYIKVFEFPQ